MARRRKKRQAARWRPATTRNRASTYFGRARYRRALRYEPLEDRRLLAVVTVDTIDDVVDFNDGLVSLREAIFATNTVPGPDTIQFAPALTAGGPTSILLAQGELAITDDLSIIGPGAELLTIDASGNDPTPDIDDGMGSRVFNIDNFSNSFVDVSLNGMTLTGADFDGSGGAISARENLTLGSMVLTANAALEGGGVYASLGDLTISSSLFTENVAVDGDGAAILHNGLGALADLRLVDTTVTANRLASKRGTVVTAQSVDATFTRSSISNNVLAGTGTDQPYALSASVRNLLIEDCAIDNNQNASGLRIASGTAFQILNSSVSGNDGRGMVITGAPGNVDRTTISDNGDTGIRAQFIGDVNLTIANSTITGNSGRQAGGIEFFSGGSFALVNSVVAENTGYAPVSTNTYGAGGMSIFASTVTISGSSIRGNVAVTGSTNTSGGGMQVSANSTIVSDSEFLDNAAVTGGGIYVQRGTASIVRSTISHNHTVGGGGGGIAFAYSSSAMTVEDSTIADNSSFAGGGIASFSTAPVEVLRSTIRGNSVYGYSPFIFNIGGGGGIYARSLTLVDSTVDGNTAEKDGGGVYAGEARIDRTTISRNAARTGAGVFLRDGTISDSTILGNTATENGGGIAVVGAGATLSQVTVSLNFAGLSGGGLWMSGATTDILHSTIAANSATVSGGGLFLQQGQTALGHSIVAINTAPTGRDLTGLFGASLNAANNLIGSNANSGLSEAPVGSPDANGNLIGGTPSNTRIDPRLGPPAYSGGPTKTLALLPDSPAINAGDPAAIPGVGSVPLFDQRGAPYARVFGGRIDIGSFESNGQMPASLVVDTLLDESNGDYSRGDFSLREAIELTNQFAGPYTITFDPALFFDGPATLFLTHGELRIRNSVNISGPGADLLVVDASGNDPTPGLPDGMGSRVFNVDDGSATHWCDVSIGGLTISGGDVDSAGGGILSQENLYITKAVVSHNTAAESGGGIRVPNASLGIVDSTIHANFAERGGGISVEGRDSIFRLVDSTVSSNTADFAGGGVYADIIDVEILHSTITENIARYRSANSSFGGGTFISPGNSGTSTSIRNAIIAGNLDTLGNPSDASFNIGTASPPLEMRWSLIGFNSFSFPTEAPVGSPDANGNLIGGPIHGAIDPLLGPLADNGGPTPTHAPLPGSPAINAGDPSATPGEGGVPVHDQRGKPFTRVYGGRIDIGAVERLPSGVLLGDYNHNGIVDGLDYGAWRDEVEVTGHRVEPLGPAVQADGNGDGLVDERDFLVWRSNYGATQADLPGPFHVVPLAAMAIERAAPTISTPPSEVTEPLALAKTSYVGGGDDSGPHVARRASRATAPRVDPGAAAQQDRLLASWAATLRGSDHRSDPSGALTRTMRHTDDATEAVAVDSVFSRWNAATSRLVTGRLRVRAK